MLVYAPRARPSAYVTWYAAALVRGAADASGLPSLLGARRFFGVADDDTFEALLNESCQNQQEVTDQLGYQVRRAVEVLVQALDRSDQDLSRNLLDHVSEKELYEAALTVMMRLVFLFCAEERGLLLLGDPLYDRNYAVSTLGAQLARTPTSTARRCLSAATTPGAVCCATFRAVYGGVRPRQSPAPGLRRRPLRPRPLPVPRGPAARHLLARGRRRAAADQQPHRPPPARGAPVPAGQGARRRPRRSRGGSPSARSTSSRSATSTRASSTTPPSRRRAGPRPRRRPREGGGDPAPGAGDLTRPRDGRPRRVSYRPNRPFGAGTHQGARRVRCRRDRTASAACDNDRALVDRVRPFAGYSARRQRHARLVITAGEPLRHPHR